LSVPATLHASPLNTPERDAFGGAMVPGAPAADAPLDDGGWLLHRLDGAGFAALVFDGDAAVVHAGAAVLPAPQVAVQVLALPARGLAAQRYDATPGTVVLLRPDQHVCARWRAPTAADVCAALQRALARA
jgi:3-(3-hydroxy-phenyl)propionate hydroxylase